MPRFMKAAAFFILGAALTDHLWGGLLMLWIWYLLDMQKQDEF